MRKVHPRWLAVVLLAAGAAAAAPRPARAEPPPLVFAAASLKSALDAVVAARAETATPEVRISYAGSGSLVRQLEHGAPAEVLFTADMAWMDYAASRGLIVASSRDSLLGNRLVLVAPRSSAAAVDLAVVGSIAAALGPGGRLAVGHVASVPAGRYALQALQKLGHWPGLERRLAQTENVRAALALVARAEARLGIVYASDAEVEPGVRVVATFGADTHLPIVYPVALTTRAKGDAARRFIAALRSPGATRIFESQGFKVLK